MTTAPKTTRTIRAAALEWLGLVDHYVSKEDKKVVFAEPPADLPVYSVGLSYPTIIELMKQEFPDCSTTSECLRWYAVKIRNYDNDFLGYTLPQIRPRAKSKKATT